MGDDLVLFLRARLDEDEQIARRATARAPGGEAWTYEQSTVRTGGSLNVSSRMVPVHGEHIARHDPARVIAEVDAKRRIIDEHPMVDATSDLERGAMGCETCAPVYSWGKDVAGGPCPTLLLMTLPYAAHPDYREEWRP